MIAGLLKILFKLFLQIVIDDALERGFVDLNTAALVLERLQQQFLNLCLFHLHFSVLIKFHRILASFLRAVSGKLLNES